MQKFYMVVSVECSGKYFACDYILHEGVNLVEILNRITGVRSAQLCRSGKQARELVESLNSRAHERGEYLFDDPNGAALYLSAEQAREQTPAY